MLCGICKVTESKYKCPKCEVPYCSLACFKSETHVHDTNPDSQSGDEVVNTEPITESIEGNKSGDSVSIYDKLVNDEVIKQLLSYDALQFHLSTLVRILNNTDHLLEKDVGNNEKVIMNLKLQDLRSGGINENELVEEFIQRVLYLLNET